LGFSVSGSAAIVFVGAFLAFSTAYTASANGFERVDDARSAVDEASLDRQNTAIAITNATYDDGNDTLRVNATNEGATTLRLGAVDVVVDNRYRDNFTDRRVEGDASTDVWLPGERLRLELRATSRPTRVKIVTGPGVAAVEVL
jgi:flagellar protein FlaF